VPPRPRCNGRYRQRFVPAACCRQEEESLFCQTGSFHPWPANLGEHNSRWKYAEIPGRPTPVRNSLTDIVRAGNEHEPTEQKDRDDGERGPQPGESTSVVLDREERPGRGGGGPWNSGRDRGERTTACIEQHTSGTAEGDRGAQVEVPEEPGMPARIPELLFEEGCQRGVALRLLQGPTSS